MLAAGWMTVIFMLSSMPGSAVPGRFGTFGHFILYAVLGVLYLLALPRSWRGWASVAAAVLLASAYGVTDEFHQSFVPGRVPDVADWLVDTGGAITAVLLTEAVLRRSRRSDVRAGDASDQ